MDKIPISFTQFMEFTTKQSGPAKVSTVRKVKYSEYSPATDYWRDLRLAIREVHEKNYSIDYLDHIVQKANDKKKSNYADTVEQYKKFIKNKHIEWFQPADAHWSFNGLFVRSTPELGLFINGKPHLLKLYFKERSEKLDKRKAASPLTLMTTSDRAHNDQQASISLLNVMKCRMFESTPSDVTSDRLLSLQGEAAHFIQIWNSLES
ncbi:hypothetical protein [Paenibacillus sp. AN1007]|uniref:Uncharacterized protein n=1 Tax=Paenibacillus sp. AN1007 TaxID=3151385 RepID=A0AAU8NGK0_9BACL